MTECTQTNFGFPSCKSRKITADFPGGNITSNGGVLLLKQADRKLGLTSAAARLIPDGRRKSSVIHTIEQMFRQRVYAIGCGEEDLNDHEDLRHDIALHAYKIVFAQAGTELFQDGVSQGATTKALDFTRDYHIVAYGQGYDSRLKSLDNVLLYSVRDADYLDSLVDDTVWTCAIINSSNLVINPDNMMPGFTYLMSGSTNLLSDPWMPAAIFTSQENAFSDTNQIGQSKSGFYKTGLPGAP